MIQKPSDKEQEYFLRVELERLKKLRDEHKANAAAADREELRRLHYLRCAKCGETMTTTKLGSVEAEVCPACGGVYLDAGELDKIVEERTRGPFAAAAGKLRAIFTE